VRIGANANSKFNALEFLAQEWTPLAAQEIVIGDAGLKTYQPAALFFIIPRRRRLGISK